MLRDSKCELNPELLGTSQQRMDEHFQQTLCDKKGPPIASRMRRGSAPEAVTRMCSAPAWYASPIKNEQLTPTGCAFNNALSQLENDENARQPRPRSPYATPRMSLKSPRSELQCTSPVQAQRTLEKILCGEKKAEDKLHEPGLHPLAYESGLSKRFLMLREYQHEVNPELVTQTHKIEADFRISLCDEKQDEDKIKLQTPRNVPVRAALVGLPGFKNLWALSRNK